MNEKLDLDVWDAQVVALLKAVTGNITHNFKEIIIDNVDGKWVLKFSLYRDSKDDLDNIRDIGTEWFSYSEDYGTGITLDDILPDQIYTDGRRLEYEHKRATTLLSYLE